MSASRQPFSPQRRAWLGLGLGAAVAGAAPRPARATTRQRLTVAAYPAVDAIVRNALPAWQRLHPAVEIEVVSRQFTDHHTAMTAALSTSSYLPDVMALEIGYVGRFARGGGLENLSAAPFGAGRFESQLVPYAWQQARSPSGTVVAMPSDIGPGTLLYRHDLFTRAGLAEADLTRSWDSYIEAGRKLRAATGAHLLPHARDMKDILIRTGLTPGQGLYFDRQSRVLVATPRFERAFRLAREVRRHRLDARVLPWSNERSEGLKRGTLASQMTGAWMAGHLANWLAPATRGLWRAAQLPEGAWAAYGGTFYAIPRDARAANKPLAWDLIRLLTLEREHQLAAFKTHDAFPALLASYDDPFFEQPIDFLGGQKARATWREAARHIVAVEVHKQDSFASEVIDTELDKVLDRDKDIGAALADAERLLAKRALR